LRRRISGASVGMAEGDEARMKYLLHHDTM
jgi:hypothetical protein